MIKEIIIKKLFDEIFSISKKRGLRFLKNNLEFNQFINDLGYKFDPEDTYSSIYIRTLLIISERLEYNQFIPLLKEKEVFESFIEADKVGGDREIFIRELNKQLHVNPNLHSLKSFDAIPSLLVSEFLLTFNDCRKDTWTPQEALFNTKLDRTDEKLDSIINTMTGFAGILSFTNEEKIVFSNKINMLSQGRINQTFEDIKKGKIDTGLKELISLKGEIWSDIDVEVRNSLTKKIAFCYLEKRELKKAISFYEEAKNIKLDAGTLSVLALLYHKEKDEVKLDEILSEFDEVDLKKANLSRIRFGTATINSDDYYKTAMSNELQDEETLLSLTQYYSEINDNEKAFNIASKLVEHFNKIEYKEYASEFGVQYIQTQGIHMGINYLNHSDKKILEKGTEFIRDCVDFYKGTEILSYKSFLSNYHAIYEMWNDNYEEAIKIVNELLSSQPNNYQFLKTLGAIYAKKRDFSKVITIYNDIPDDAGIDDLPLMKSICFFILNDIGKAKEILIEGLKWIIDPKIKERTVEQLVNFYFFSDDIEGAEKIYIENINLLGNKNKKIIQAKLYRFSNKIPDAKKILIELKDEIIDSMSFTALILEVGGEFEKIGEISQTIELYEKFADYENETFFVKALFDLYVDAGMFNAAVKICEKQRKSEVHEFYTRNEIAIYYNYKDYDKVIEFAKRYLEKYPKNIEIRIHLIHSLLKKNQKAKARDYLKYPFEIKKLNYDNARNLLALYLSFNFYEDAFEIAYSLLAFYDDSSFHDLYILLCTQNDKYLSSIKPNRIWTDTTVSILENGELMSITFVDRESEAFLANYYNEIRNDHDKYHRIYGKTAGYKETFKFGNETFEIEILEIKHRYVFAFHKALKECGNFKSESAITILDTNSFKNGKLPDVMQKILDESEESQVKFEDFLRQYESGKIPLICTAIAFGYEFMDVWKLCSISRNHFIRAGSGNFVELELLNTFFQSNNKKELLFDLTSLLLLYKIGLVDFIKSTFNIYVLQDALDYIEDYILKESINGEGKSGQLTRINGKNYFIEQSIDEKMIEIREFELFKNWTKANFRIYTPEILLDINKTELDEYVDTLVSRHR